MVDGGAGVGRGGVCGEGDDRAVREILFEFASQSPIELPHHDANRRVEVARFERDEQIEVVVVGERHDRGCAKHARRAQGLFIVRPALDEGRPQRAHFVREAAGAVLPKDCHDLSACGGQLVARFERQRVAADDDDQRERVGGFRGTHLHIGLSQPFDAKAKALPGAALPETVLKRLMLDHAPRTAPW